MIGSGFDAVNECGKGFVLGLEAFVEALGNPVTIKGATQALDNVGEGDGFFFFQRPDNLAQLLPQRFATGALVPGVCARGVGLAGDAGLPR